MGVKDISVLGFFYCSLLLLIPMVIDVVFKLRLFSSIAISIVRMSVQLVFAGLFLTVLFKLDNLLFSLLWVLIMILVATVNVINTSDLKLIKFFWPTMISFIFSTLFIVLYFNGLVVGLDNVFVSKYLIIISGMIMGNSLKNNIVGLSTFYKSVQRNENRYLYSLSCGTTLWEALSPFIKESLLLAFKPTIATMATMGIIALPGMMTGQILGGSDPLVAIKYQIAIMIAIFVATVLSLSFTIILTIRKSFNAYGILNKEIFK
ncbi:MAG: ABC transporter ATP-binding protein [Candidatus Margulisbacteria bacterium GWF2_35_9]|nr:MAG: ABC transporter ATP-binding protein [Candidatus Margulisbacteria bacterium GWF2_35_9]